MPKITYATITLIKQSTNQKYLREVARGSTAIKLKAATLATKTKVRSRPNNKHLMMISEPNSLLNSRLRSLLKISYIYEENIIRFV